MAGFYQRKPLSYAMIFANLILLPIAILLSQMGYSWKGPLVTTLPNPFTQGEPLRASSPRTTSTAFEYSQGWSLYHPAEPVLGRPHRQNVLHSVQREPPVLFCAGCLWSCLWAPQKRVCLTSLCTLSSDIHTLWCDPPPWAVSGSPVSRNDPVSVS